VPIDGAEREFLLSVFLMEAWDAIATLEEEAVGLEHGADVEMLRVVAHRLRGSAALHGFAQVSALAAQMQDVVEAAAAGGGPARRDAALALGDLILKMKHALERADDRDALDPEPPGEPLAQWAASPTVPVPPSVPDEATAELERFFAVNAEVLRYFLPEADEHLEEMTSSLLGLEQHGRDDGRIAQLFRAVHTLKGAAYTVGCRPVGDLAHGVEDLLAAVRDGALEIGPTVFEAVFASIDALKLMLKVAGGASPGLAEARDRARHLLATVVIGRAATVADAVPMVQDEPEPALEAAVAEAPRSMLEASPLDWRAAHPDPALARPALAPRPEPSPRGPQPTIRVALDRLDRLMNLVGQLVGTRTRLEHRLADLDHIADLLRVTNVRMAKVVGEFETKYLDPRLPRPGVPTVPVPAEGLDPGTVAETFEELEFDRYDDFNVLARSVGELSTDVREIQAQLTTAMRAFRNEVATVQRLGGQLRTDVGRARMVPVARLFGRLPRQAREIAQAAHRMVSLAIEGETVEIDSTVSEHLVDPLLHLIQNAIVHGIEPEEERQRLGKPPAGVITLRAHQKGGAIHVEVADDGRGIDVEAVTARALERGLVPPDTLGRLTPREAVDLIFVPGVSTAAELTSVAGRGVGMDIVRTNVARLGGDIDVDSRTGEGTRFTIKLPLTVAITDALIVRTGREVFAIPVGAVRTVAAVRRDSLEVVDGDERVAIGEETLPLIRLDEVLGIPAARPSDPLPVLVLRAGRQSLAVAVDEVVRKDEVVLKSLGRFLEGLAPYAGATISADGRVVLILEATRLLDVRASAAPRGRADRERGAVRSLGPRERRVLLVDDSVSVRRFVGQMLERAGLEVVTANDGAEALERLREVSVDAIVTDLEMPRINGYELIRSLRQRAATRTVPIVVLTTRAGEKHLDLARRLGVTHYVTKPIEEQAFVKLVESVTSGQGAGAGVVTP
jgi:chemosensory pili system protein ChpA (sensor histidine kinase/response regulator)